MTIEEATSAMRIAAEGVVDWGRRRFPIGTPLPLSNLDKAIKWLEGAEAAGADARPESEEGEVPWRAA